MKNFQIIPEEIKKSMDNLKSEKNMIYQKSLNEVTANKDKQGKRCIAVI